MRAQATLGDAFGPEGPPCPWPMVPDGMLREYLEAGLPQAREEWFRRMGGGEQVK